MERRRGHDVANCTHGVVHKPGLDPLLWVQVAEQMKECLLPAHRVIIVSLSLTELSSDCDLWTPAIRAVSLLGED